MTLMLQSFPANAGAGSTFAFDISNLVRKWYEGSNYGVAFERKITATPNTVEFGSSDSVYHKPVIMINYVSFAGLQNHLAYDSFDCGRAGTGYVNLYNGDVVIARPLTQCGGNRMPVSITAYYGARLSGITARVGSHWRLSCDQSMTKSYINDELYFIWSKGDGDQQYFKKPSSSAAYYEDLSGLSLKLTDNGTYTEIEDKGGTVMRFESPQDALDDTGRLLSITDSCGNTNTFQYGDWRLESITDGAGRVRSLPIRAIC
ncbi:MAG: RHS repeat domain-containing protein [Christensenellales bacterium]